MLFGVPKSSVLGPLLFVLYTLKHAFRIAEELDFLIHPPSMQTIYRFTIIASSVIQFISMVDSSIASTVWASGCWRIASNWIRRRPNLYGWVYHVVWLHAHSVRSWWMGVPFNHHSQSGITASSWSSFSYPTPRVLHALGLGLTLDQFTPTCWFPPTLRQLQPLQGHVRRRLYSFQVELYCILVSVADLIGGGAMGAIAPPIGCNLRKKERYFEASRGDRPPQKVSVSAGKRLNSTTRGSTSSTTSSTAGAIGIHWTSSTTPPSKSDPENSTNYPPPLEVTECYRLPPPSKSGRKSHQLPPPPPRIHVNVTDYPPPRNLAGKLHQLPPPPANSRNVTDYPPLEIWPEKSPTTPPPLEFTERYRLPPPSKSEPEKVHQLLSPPEISRNGN